MLLLQGEMLAPHTLVPTISSTGIAGLVLYFWRVDRQDRAKRDEEREKQIEKQRSEELQRVESITKSFQQIVVDNTKAMQALTDLLPFVCKAESASVREVVDKLRSNEKRT
ncbi:MAG: hypothetical protein U0Q18_25285 [Bryobacteraceae bacterium]